MTAVRRWKLAPEERTRSRPREARFAAVPKFGGSSRGAKPLSITGALIALVVTAVAGVAVAQDDPRARTASGQILIVLASRQAGPVDPRLANVPALRRSPFDVFQSMELLESPRVSLEVGDEQIVELPNGRRLRLVLRQITDEGRFRMQLSINRPGQRDYLPELDVVASPGDPVFIAGQSYRNGTLVIGIRLGQRTP